MKRQLLLALAATGIALPTMAGGLVTNTNQNAAFLRQLSQDAIIDITGLYMNPAGTAFLAPGAHVSFNIQNAKQSRDIATTFPLFALNTNNNSTTHEFKGDAYAPVIPSIQFSYNWEKWSINANFALGGGGGKCEFDQGLGSFEALYAGQLFQLVPAQVNAQLSATLPGQLTQGLIAQGVPQPYAEKIASTVNYHSALTGYSLDAFMKGRQYYFGLSVGATYKVMDNLALFSGLRAVYSTNNYNGYVQDVKAKYGFAYEVPEWPALGFPGTSADGAGEQDLSQNSLTLNADQTGWGFTPMFGIDWKINEHWNLAAKYEFKTRLRLENKTEMNDVAKAQITAGNAVLGQFADGTKIATDIPAMLAAGVQYSPISALRLQAGYHWYGDKSATQYGNKQDLIDDNTWEITAGVEYDVCKWVTLSGGWQSTNYGLSDVYMNDLSFTTNSNSWGVGARINLTEKWNIDLGFMQTLYKDREVNAYIVNPATSSIPSVSKTDVYSRTNRVLGIGLNFNF